MKKISLLLFVLIAGLPGCCKRKRCNRPMRENVISRSIEVPSTSNLNEEEADLDKELDDLEEYLLNDFEDEGDEYEADESDDDEDDKSLMMWIDDQPDDELRKIYFSFNHYGIREDQKASLSYDIEQVKQLVAEADTSAQPTIVIEGHACQEGSQTYNLALSEKRAKYIADLFVAAGIDSSLIKVVGRGQACPVEIEGKVADGSREQRAPNRRVEVRVIYT